MNDEASVRSRGGLRHDVRNNCLCMNYMSPICALGIDIGDLCCSGIEVVMLDHTGNQSHARNALEQPLLRYLSSFLGLGRKGVVDKWDKCMNKQV